MSKYKQSLTAPIYVSSSDFYILAFVDRLIVKRIFDKYDILNIQLTNFQNLTIF